MTTNDGAKLELKGITNGVTVGWSGSLRDWFAGMAMQTVIMPEIKRIDRWEREAGVDESVTITWDIGDASQWAESCYAIADAMLAEREKEACNGKA